MIWCKDFSFEMWSRWNVSGDKYGFRNYIYLFCVWNFVDISVAWNSVNYGCRLRKESWYNFAWFYEDCMVVPFMHRSLCVEVYVIAIAFTICSLSQPATIITIKHGRSGYILRRGSRIFGRRLSRPILTQSGVLVINEWTLLFQTLLRFLWKESLLAIINKHGFPIREHTLLFQALLRCLWAK